MKTKPLLSSLVVTAMGREKGFSLVELMVAMTIGLFLLAGLLYVYIGASQSSRFQGALSQMQTNARYAFELMSRDIRMAGFTGSLQTNPSNIAPVPLGSQLCSLVNLFGNLDCTGVSSGPLVGYSNTNPPGVCTTADTTPCYLADPDADAATSSPDSLTMVRTDTENSFALNPGVALTNIDFTLSAWPADSSLAPKVNEVFVAANYAHSGVFQISAINAGAATVSYIGGTLNTGQFGGPSAVKLYRLNGASYYIGRNLVGEPALYRSKLGLDAGGNLTPITEELIQGVENMQITYGVDTDPDALGPPNPVRPGDGNINGYWTAAQINANVPGIASNLCNNPPVANSRWKCVLSMRVTLTMVSGQNEKVGASGDQLRTSFTSTLAIRNRLP